MFRGQTKEKIWNQIDMLVEILNSEEYLEEYEIGHIKVEQGRVKKIEYEILRCVEDENGDVYYYPIYSSGRGIHIIRYLENIHEYEKALNICEEYNLNNEGHASVKLSFSGSEYYLKRFCYEQVEWSTLIVDHRIKEIIKTLGIIQKIRR